MNRIRTKKILAAVIVLTLIFIWGHSLVDRENSAKESGFVLRLLTPVLELVLGKGNVTEHFVRKLAHFGEFFVLGAELLWFFSLSAAETAGADGCFDHFPVRPGLTALAHGMFAAFTDETLQIFSGRGSQIPDVWLDIAGAAAGILLFGIIMRTIITVRSK